jgi:two-component system alkaline phosphatase synthesis response regulator PhoP
MVQGTKRVDIAIIEDDASIASFLSELLGMEGYRAVAFPDGNTLDAVLAAAPRLILLDLMLPTLDGAEVCRRLRADPRARTTPIVIMTAAAPLAASQWLRGCAHSGLLPKPFDIDEILDIAERYLRPRAPEPLPAEIAHGECNA